MAPSTARLYGRERELELIRSVIDGVQQGGRELLLRGEAGIGKSSLLAAAVTYATESGFRVLQTSGVQSETNLPFAGLHHVLHPIQGGVGALAEPQRRALESAFGSVADSAPDLFLIALATLNLLADAAAEAPVILVADDLQFIDRPTCEVLAFVARRLESDPIVLLGAIRDGYETSLNAARLREVRVEPLNDNAAASLLDERAPGLSDLHRLTLLGQAAGNPLALAELPVSPLPAVDSIAPALALSERLQEAFVSRVQALPQSTGSFLLAAATDDAGNLEEVFRAASVLDSNVSEDDMARSISALLVHRDGSRLRFRHPLVRSAIYQAALPGERRLAHAALGAVIADPDRAAWHRAASVAGQDDQVAAEMESTSRRALQRGALSVARSAMERAAELAVDPSERSRYLVHTATISADVEPRNTVMELLHRISPTQLTPPLLAEFEHVRERINAVPYSDLQRTVEVARLAQSSLRDGNTNVALELLVQASNRGYFSNADAATRRLICDIVEEHRPLIDDPRLLMALVQSDPDRFASEVSREVASAVPGGRTAEVDMYWSNAAIFYGGYVEASELLPPILQRLRSSGKLLRLTSALMSSAWVAIHLSALDVAETAIDEGLRLSQEFPNYHVGFLRVGELIVAALRGDGEEARRLAPAVEQEFSAEPLRPLGPLLQLAHGVVSLSQGRYSEAFDAIKVVFDPRHSRFASREVTRVLCLGYLADAAHHSGRRDEAATAIADAEAVAFRLPAPLLHQHVRFASAVIATDEEAEERFGVARDAAGPSSFWQANLSLAWGTRLRRQRRAVEARAFLRSASETFARLGTGPWEERARLELTASGERARRRDPSVSERLTPQELQIAGMVARGMSNRDIAEQLFLSPRTVGSHLYRIFPKLNIRSRGEVASALEPDRDRR